MRWWRENPRDVPAPFDATIPIEGLIIAGRDKSLDDDSRRRLLHINHGYHDLSVITYDDLLRRLDQLMSSLGYYCWLAAHAVEDGSLSLPWSGCSFPLSNRGIIPWTFLA